MFSSFPKKGESKVTNKSPNISGPAIAGTERGRTAYYGHYLGVIKDLYDPSHMGIVRVFIPEICGLDPDDDTRWIHVSYASPFFNNTTPSSKNVGQQASGFWATPVDVEQTVIVIFIKGDVNQGFYVACVPEAFQNRDIAGNNFNSTNDKDLLNYGNPIRQNVVNAEKNSGGVNQQDNFRRVKAGLGASTGRAPYSGPLLNTPTSSIVLRSPGNLLGPNTKDPAINSMGYTAKNYPDVDFIV